MQYRARGAAAGTGAGEANEGTLILVEISVSLKDNIGTSPRSYLESVLSLYCSSRSISREEWIAEMSFAIS